MNMIFNPNQLYADHQETYNTKIESLPITPTIPTNRKDRIYFYRDYLSKYYPKALVIRNFFNCMTALDVAKSLQEVISMLSENPELYFSNSHKFFKITHYWEHVVDQLSLISEFLEIAQVSTETGTIVLPKEKIGSFLNNFSFEQWENTQIYNQSLSYVLKTTKGSNAYFQLYALSFDYLIKLFNEGVLLLNLGQALNYQTELEYVLEKLHGSCYEAEYFEYSKTVQELVTLLKINLNK